MSKHKLLLADDSVTIQKVVNLTFADEGIEVITVGDGDAAMQKFTEGTPDLVMVDVNMPGLDGYRICEMIKQDDETKHIPVILLVGSFEPFDEEEARRVGADDFLTKPFQSIRQLVNKVSDLLNADETVADVENEAAVVNSFDDTLKTIPPVEDDSIADLGDAGMDDEMILTNQISILPTSEKQTFMSEPHYESSADDEDFAALEQHPHSFENSAEYANDWAETQPSLKEETFNDRSASSDTISIDDGIYEFTDEEDSVQEDLNAEFEQLLANNNLTSMPEDASVFALDDFDLLELPQSKKDASSKNQSSDKFNVSRKTSNENQSETGAKTSGDDAAQTGGLSPEAIEAIADRVAEKISDRVIRKVVKEVIAQMAKKK